ncbi:MAG: laccase domain-containing protein [Candidatus Berkiella sp.]
MKHFFSTRKEGVNNSHELSAWRFGSGNVHSSLKEVTADKIAKPTTPEEQEYVNAIDNLKALVAAKPLTPSHEVILYSQYGKGISVVTDELLASKDLPRDPSGRLIIPGDGLFTTNENVLLLNKSGDAHAIIIKSPQAVGIVVGSWRCIKKGILPFMLEHFLKLPTDPKDIKIHIGPGLGPDSYDLSEENYQEILRENPLFSEAFIPKPTKHKNPIVPVMPIPAAAGIAPPESTQQTKESVPVVEPEKNEETKVSAPVKPKKYILNFVQLIKIFAQELEIEVIDNETTTTFNRANWRQVKTLAKNKKIQKC